jgi:AraC-like DNA-binding protein
VAESIHHSTQHPCALGRVEARTLVSNHTFPRHAHDGFGIGVMFCGGQRSWSGRGAVETRAGEVLTHNPGEMHDGLPYDGAARGWRMLHLEPQVVAAQLAGGNAVGSEITQPTIRNAGLARVVERLFARMTGISETLAIEEDLLAALVRVVGRRVGSPCETAPVRLARQRIDDAPERAPRLAELADLSGISRFQLLRSFAREVGVTPYAYLVQRRVSVARRLLAGGCAPAEAALAAGFADQSHLTRAFRRQFGVTPGQYRRALV